MEGGRRPSGVEAVERVRELYERVGTAVDGGLEEALRAVRNGTAAALRAGRSLAAARRSLARARRAAKQGERRLDGQHVERQSGENAALQRRIEWLDEHSYTLSRVVRHARRDLVMMIGALSQRGRGPDRDRELWSEPLMNEKTESGAEGLPQRRFRSADRVVHHRRNRMMARTKRSRRSYSAGEWGRTRVRVFADPKTGLYQSRVARRTGAGSPGPLKHRDWWVESEAARPTKPPRASRCTSPTARPSPSPNRSPWKGLFEIYGGGGDAHQGVYVPHARPGRRRRCSSTSSDGTEDPRRCREGTGTGSSGRGARAESGRAASPCPDQTIHGDLTFLMAVLNWGREVEGRARLPAPRQKPAQGAQEARREETLFASSLRTRNTGRF